MSDTIKTIYHGSDHIIKRPLFGFGKPGNDYGSGFYCTETLEMAKEWGVGKEKNGFANRYTIDIDGLYILNLNKPDFSVLHWLAVLLENRQFAIGVPLARQAREYIISNFHVDYSKADIIVGYRADDSYFSFAQDFINGTISVRQLENAMHLGKLGQQFVVKSKAAFERICFEGFEIANCAEWYVKRMLRDSQARKDYLDEERYKVKQGDLFVSTIITEEMKPDDARLQQHLS